MTEWAKEQQTLINDVLKFEENMEGLKPPTREEMENIREVCSKLELIKFKTDGSVTNLFMQIERFAKEFLSPEDEDSSISAASVA